MSLIKKTLQYGEHTLVLETGLIAKQATASVLVSLGDTVVLVTVVAGQGLSKMQGSLPLRVDYQERYYAAGKIPGGFFKREGRPTERETLIARLMDRPIRPLFAKGFSSDVQVVATVLSLDPNIDADIPALVGASAALRLSGLPVKGPMGAARVGYKDGQYILNPSQSLLKESELDLVVAATHQSVLMVESEAHELSEAIMLGAVSFGHKACQLVIEAIESFAQTEGAAKPSMDWTPVVEDALLSEQVRRLAEQDTIAAYQIHEKGARALRLKTIHDMVVEALATAEHEERKTEVEKILEKLDRSVVRGRILEGQPRIDGRDFKTIRPISGKAGFLKRVHGSALFTRGETQAIVALTLGTTKDAQLIDSPLGEYKDPFMLHYNFPPYSVGEIGMMGSPKRREIGHGMLAKRGMRAVLPKDYPYVLRIVSEITESNGSSSMATVCGTTLALMDAGVPIKSPVAGIAMGLVKDGDRFQVLSDILGDEDHLGDMDFKVAGTALGVTALQMDIKIDGITEAIMEVALDQAKAGRQHILGVMNQILPASRGQTSAFAPQIITLKINPEKIRDVIGKGGSVIRALTDNTGVTVDINDDGTIQIAAVDRTAAETVCRRIAGIVEEPEIGKIYEGRVARIVDFGAFVTFLPGRDGLVHISEITHERVDSVSDVLSEGESVKVRVLEIDRQGRVRLSIKAVQEDGPAQND